MYPFKEIKEHYENLTPLIFERSKEHGIGAWMNPYCGIDWMATLSPIEKDTWYAIRSFGKSPLYPQYPVGKFFVDFGNPVAKVAVECDGAEYHLDKEKDAARDLELKKLGWVVYRITGKECVKIIDEYEDVFDCDDSDAYSILSEVYNTTIEGLLKAIAIFHFDFIPFKRNCDQVELARICLLKKVSVDSNFLDKLYHKAKKRIANAYLIKI